MCWELGINNALFNYCRGKLVHFPGKTAIFFLAFLLSTNQVGIGKEVDPLEEKIILFFEEISFQSGDGLVTACIHFKK